MRISLGETKFEEYRGTVKPAQIRSPVAPLNGISMRVKLSRVRIQVGDEEREKIRLPGFRDCGNMKLVGISWRRRGGGRSGWFVRVRESSIDVTVSR